MFSSVKQVAGLGLVCAFILAVPPASAHPPRLLPNPYYYYSYPAPYPYFYPPFAGYSPYGYGPYLLPDPYGYLKGTAEVINSQGQYLKNVQEAYLLQEQVRKAQLENRRRAYDEWLWERSNLPTLNQERERTQREELRRSLNQPPATEIWSGKSLNDILANLLDLRSKGYEGPEVPVDASVLKKINVAVSRGGSQAGLLRDAGNLDWPLGLRNLAPAGETRVLRQQVDALLATSKKQAVAAGRVDAGLLNELGRNVAALRRLLADQVGDFSFNQYTEAKQFLRQLDDAVTTLQQPDAAHYVTGRYSAQGNTVKELVHYLSDNGLRFAPGGSGDEGAYNALYLALLQYHQGASLKLPTK
jgi:hypothetical protein